ncbi:IDEAL domain-containing protein [Sutcliffiella horikoshii]|uniref:IDEAL domain-containing protein n=1 Tax=Sutcliffiella horikoshii TaxID=79883 RepID=UPI0007D0B17F|nr:IDEAL domain-containing protein [Sutcliffiella horikoshii]MCM3616953.1 IDEAL domain-containing protein [Sutcliffiella horikoshii]
MKNEKSYTELMKAKKMNKKVSVEAYMMNVYVQMIIDESLFHYHKNLLQEKIDGALDAKDPSLFHLLSTRYKKFLNDWGISA